MILSIDFNPAVEMKHLVDNIGIGKKIEADKSVYYPRGNGVLVSQLLNIFGETSFMTGFLGGLYGEFLHSKLQESRIAHEFVPIRDRTRALIRLVDRDNEHTVIMEKSPRITRDELINMYDLFERLLDKSGPICGLDFIPMAGISKTILYDFISLANRRDKKFILDVKNQISFSGLDASPYMAILSLGSLEEHLKLELHFENEMIKVGRFLLDKGIEYLVIDLEEKGSMVLGQDRGYRVEIPYFKEKVQYDDHSSMVAGFALGVNRGYDLEMNIRLGQAFNMVTALEYDVDEIQMSDIKKAMGELEIFPINYY
ncbi:MAG: PfkB family carbohydrate kinase [Tissierellaceae bacterium]